MVVVSQSIEAHPYASRNEIPVKIRRIHSGPKIERSCAGKDSIRRKSRPEDGMMVVGSRYQKGWFGLTHYFKSRKLATVQDTLGLQNSNPVYPFLHGKNPEKDHNAVLDSKTSWESRQ